MSPHGQHGNCGRTQKGATKLGTSMIDLDTVKSVFQVHAVHESETVGLRRKLRRSELIKSFEKQEACTVVMEACGAAHHWARMLIALAHDVKLIAPEAVGPFVKKTARRTTLSTRRQSARSHHGPT
jgi:transposase